MVDIHDPPSSSTIHKYHNKLRKLALAYELGIIPPIHLFLPFHCSTIGLNFLVINICIKGILE